MQSQKRKNMELDEKIKDYLEQKNQLQKSANILKIEFTKYITNKNIPLLERWGYYIKAPNDVKYIKTDLISPKSKFLQQHFRHRFDAPEVYGRGKRIYINDIFGDLVWKGQINLEEYNYKNPGLTEEEVFEGMEELLEENLDYFTFDW